MKRVKAKCFPVIVYESIMMGDEFFNSDLVKYFEVFKDQVIVTISNRNFEAIANVAERVYAGNCFVYFLCKY
jgi:UDPglucose 6-dehydrogenase